VSPTETFEEPPLGYEPTGEWDRELTEYEWSKMLHSTRSLRLDAALERKIKMLERWAEVGPPSGVDQKILDGERTALRSWHDSSRGLWSWKKSTPDSLTGRNSKLMERWRTALDRIAGRPRHAQSSKSERDAQYQTITALKRQVAELIADKAWLEEQLVLAEIPSGPEPRPRKPHAKKTGSRRR